MMAADAQRFDTGALRKLAGEKVFARGEIYFRGDQVRILAVEPGRVLAQVAGTQDYRTELTGRGRQIGGECSCRAFEDRGFCKHMVAAALAANAAGDEAQGGGALARIRGHLSNKGVDALVAMIMDIAERDQALLRRLDTAAAIMDADDKTLGTRLRKAIDAATRTRGFVDYRAAPGWAADVDAALDAVAELASGPRAGLALELAERALDRIEKAIENIDDSDGHCGALLNRALEIHLCAALAAKPDPVKLARELFKREMEDGYGAFGGSAGVYAEVLGAPGLAEYRRLAAEAWEKLPALHGGRKQREASGDYRLLHHILDGFAERDGDVAARIALRAKDLSSAWNYVQLARFCVEQGRAEEALRRVEEALFLFEDERPDEGLVSLAADLLSKAGRKGDAEAHLWRAFEKEPTFGLFTRLRALAGAAAVARVTDHLQARAAKSRHRGRNPPVDLLIRILTLEKMFDAAWAAARAHCPSVGVREDLARASEATHPGEALKVYSERVDALVVGVAYVEAAAFIARMAGLRGADEQAAYVAALKLRFARKRNFMKLLG